MKKNISSISIYFFSSSLNKAIPFFLLPILTTYLKPEEYGTWSIYQALIAFSIPLIGMNMQTNITRNFFNTKKEELAKIISNLLFMLFVSVVLVSLITLIVLSYNNEPLLGIENQYYMILIIISMMTVLHFFNLTLLRNMEKPFKYAFFEILYTSLNMLISIYLIIVSGYGWDSLVYGTLASTFLVGFFGIILIYKRGYLKFDINSLKIKELYMISLPLIPHAISGAIISLSDRMIIDSLLGKEMVGLYTIAFTFGMIVYLITDSFNKWWSTWMYKQLSNIGEDTKNLIVKITYLYNISIFIIAGIVSLVSYFMFDLFINIEYASAKQYIFWLSLGFAMQGVYFMYFPYIVHMGKTKYLAIISSTAAIINIILNYVLIELNGLYGAAQATFVSYLFMALSLWWLSNKYYPMPWYQAIRRWGE